MLDQALAVEHEITALTSGETGLVRVGGFFTAWRRSCPTPWRNSRALARTSGSQLQQVEPEPALRALRVGDLDVTVVYRFGFDRGEDERLEWTHLLDDPYALALPAGHRLASRDRIPLADLAQERAR